MAIFKYTVANRENKKLSGTVEAPDELTARTELNNLGFSILSLEVTSNQPVIDSNLTKFAFEAIDQNSKLITGTIPSDNEETAFAKLEIEYQLTVTAIWQDGANEEQIAQARKKGTRTLQEKLEESLAHKSTDGNETVVQIKSLEEQKQEVELKAKIEEVLKVVNKLLSSINDKIDPDQKVEINKRIDKLLRIKNSTNLNYILKTADELLEFIESQEKSLKEKGFEEKRLELEITTKKLIDDLNRGLRKKTFSEDVVEKIESWEKSHKKNDKTSTPTKFIGRVLKRIKNLFTTPPQIKVIKDQIKIYNGQLWEFTKLYFKEPTATYKARVKESLKTIWKARKKAKSSLREAKKIIKERKKIEQESEALVMPFLEEMNSFTGWLLALYVIYYFVALYLNTKNFGLGNLPRGFTVYDSSFFKFILVAIFLLHSSIALKINFFPKNLLANFIIPPIFLFSTIIALLNF